MMTVQTYLENPRYNGELLVSDAQHFAVKSIINPFMHEGVTVDRAAAQQEHDTIVASGFRTATARIEQVASPGDCQDGIYTANWALCLNGIALMANLPYARRGEMHYAADVLQSRGFIIDWTARDRGYDFSGQGGALLLPGSNIMFVENGSRTDSRMNPILESTFGVKTVGLTGIPERRFLGMDNLRIGKTKYVTEDNGHVLRQSPGYDIDLLVGILGDKRIAYAPSLLTADSRRIMQRLDEGIEKIAVSRREALGAYACNLVSVQGQDGVWRVVVNHAAKRLIKRITSYPDMQVIPQTNDVIKAGGGGFRCVSLTLNGVTRDYYDARQKPAR